MNDSNNTIAKDLESTVLSQTILRKIEEGNQLALSFFREHADRLQSLALVMSNRFQKGGRLLVMGNGGSACDAEHVVTEFMHPIFAKRRPLPAICLSSNMSLITAVANDLDYSRIFANQILQLANPQDMVLAISTSGMSANLVSALSESQRLGLTTIVFAGKDGGRTKDFADWDFTVHSYSIHRIQEVHVRLLHLLWDLVHIQLGEDDIV